jgi:alkanesulfonate monooxygenase
MSLEFLWYIPNTVDPGHRGDPTVEGWGTLDFSAEQARLLEQHGWGGALLGTSWGRPDTFTVATAVAARTTTFKPLIAIRPGYWQPAHFASAAATLDQLTGGRVLVNIVTGTDNLAAYGDGNADPARRYDRTREFLQLVRRLWTQESVTYRGEHFQVEASTLAPRPYRAAEGRHPTLYFGGASEAAERVSAAEADVQLFWGEPLGGVAERIARLRALSGSLGSGSPRWCGTPLRKPGGTPRKRWPRWRRRRVRYACTIRAGRRLASSACSTWPRGVRCWTPACTPHRAGSVAAARPPPGWLVPRLTSPRP